MGNQLGLFNKTTATIPISTTTSDVIDCVSKGPPAALQMPAAFTGTTVSFLCATTETGTFQALYDAGANVSLTVAASKYVRLDPAIFYCIKYMKIVSGSSEAAEREIEVVHRET